MPNSTQQPLIRECLMKGMTPKEIVKQFPSVWPTSITRAREKLGIPKFKPGRTRDIRIYDCLKRGMHPMEIMKLLPDVRARSVNYAMKQLGMPRLGRGRPKGAKSSKLWASLDRIRRMKQDGKPYTEIAALFGVSHQRIAQIMSSRPMGGIGPCAHCGITKPLSRHHLDYAHDLVVYVCRSCHQQLHLLAKAKEERPSERVPNA